MIKNQFDRANIIFCFTSIFQDMNVNRIMVIRIEHKPKSKKYKYCWHIFFLFGYTLFCLQR